MIHISTIQFAAHLPPWLTVFLITALVSAQQTSLPNEPADRVEIDRTIDRSGEVRFGRFQVYENREAQSGRVLELDFVVLRANGPRKQPDPVFFLAGGPGQAAATLWERFENSWMRAERDIVLVNQRGTGGSNRLQVSWMRDPNDPQQLLNPQFDVELIRTEMERLAGKADLTMYSTPLAMDDLNEIRQALGYEQINITGGSYGTRAALVYIRQHGETVRTAILNGVAPIAFRNPLYHAKEAQLALDLLFAEVEGNKKYAAAFPDLRDH